MVALLTDAAFGSQLTWTCERFRGTGSQSSVPSRTRCQRGQAQALLLQGHLARVGGRLLLLSVVLFIIVSRFPNSCSGCERGCAVVPLTLFPFLSPPLDLRGKRLEEHPEPSAGGDPSPPSCIPPSSPTAARRRPLLAACSTVTCLRPWSFALRSVELSRPRTSSLLQPRPAGSLRWCLALAPRTTRTSEPSFPPQVYKRCRLPFPPLVAGRTREAVRVRTPAQRKVPVLQPSPEWERPGDLDPLKPPTSGLCRSATAAAPQAATFPAPVHRDKARVLKRRAGRGPGPSAAIRPGRGWRCTPSPGSVTSSRSAS